MVKKTAADVVGEDGDSLSDSDRRALRGSRFAPLPPPSHSPLEKSSRLAHPGGPVATNKAAALAKFLERKMREPGGIGSLNPDHIELAVVNAKETLRASRDGGASTVRHVTSFLDSSVETSENDADKEEVTEEIVTSQWKRKKIKIEGELGQSSNRRKKMAKEIKKKKKRKQLKKKRKEKRL